MSFNPINTEVMPVSSNLSRFWVAVDDVKDGEIIGRLCNHYECIVKNFTGTLQLITYADDFFDKHNYPQATHEMRSFNQAKSSSQNSQKIDDSEVLKVDESNIIIESGGKATFMIQVQYRQNATWQGTIKWTEGKKIVHFRSGLELIKLIDEAVACSDVKGSSECAIWSEAEKSDE